MYQGKKNARVKIINTKKTYFTELYGFDVKAQVHERATRRALASAYMSLELRFYNIKLPMFMPIEII